MKRRVDILFETDGLVAAVKPAGMPTVPDHVGSSHAFVSLVAEAVGRKPSELRVTSRLDRDVSGAIVFAEASVTLYTLQDAVNAPDHRIVFPFRQPTAVADEIDWPTEFVIEYLPDSGGVRVGFQKFVHQTAG